MATEYSLQHSLKHVPEVAEPCPRRHCSWGLPDKLLTYDHALPTLPNPHLGGGHGYQIHSGMGFA